MGQKYVYFLSAKLPLHLWTCIVGPIYIYISRHSEVQLYHNLMQTSGQQLRGYFRSLAHGIQRMSTKLLSPKLLLW